MGMQIGRSLRLSVPRRFIADLLHFAEQVPAHTIQRTMRLAPVVSARQAAWPRPGWCAIFLKAYALLAVRRPCLRHIYVPYPWAHLYEHPENIASVAITRDWGDGEEAVFFARFRSPEKQGLWDIEKRLRSLKDRPIEAIGDFRRIIRVTRLIRPVRHLLWWLGLNIWGPLQAEYLGTFGLSVVSSLGAAGFHLQSPLSSALNYGVINADGTLDVRLTYDHRVRDGATVARLLADLEDVLHSDILNELGYLRSVEAA